MADREIHEVRIESSNDAITPLLVVIILIGIALLAWVMLAKTTPTEPQTTPLTETTQPTSTEEQTSESEPTPTTDASTPETAN